MNTTTSAPPRQRLISGGGALLFISLFLPWSTLSTGGGTESTPGWNGYATVDGTPLIDGVGVLAGTLATLLLLWELLRHGCARARALAHRCDLYTALLAGVAAVVSVVLFVSALIASRASVGVAPTGVEGSPSIGFGAVLTLISGISLGTGASLAVRAYTTS